MINRCKQIVLYIFNAREGYKSQSLFWFWSVALYIAGFYLWGSFLNWGNLEFNFQDWFEITGPRLYFLKNAIMQGVPPLHMTGTSALILLTDRFMSIPDQILSPQILLMNFMSPSLFVLVHWLLLYSVGFVGLLLFSRKYRLSPFVLTIIFLLFNFNGQIEAHLSIGHLTWGGYFLFPWFVCFVLELQDNAIRWRWVFKVAGLLFIIFLQGSFHQFVWSLIFLGILAVVFYKHFWAVMMAGVFACLLSAVRIFPAILITGKVDQDFLGGFPSIMDLWSGLIQLRPPAAAIQGFTPHAVYVWEYDFYIGLAGTVILLYFGIYLWLRNSDISFRFIFPIFGLLLLSLAGIYEIINFLPIPIFDGERMTTRLFSLPLVFLILFAGINLQKWVNQPACRPYRYLLLLVGAGILCSDLWSHFQLWQVTSVAAQLGGLRVFNPAMWGLANYVDSLYTGMLRRGLVMTAISAVLAMVMAWINPAEGFPVNLVHYIFKQFLSHCHQT